MSSFLQMNVIEQNYEKIATYQNQFFSILDDYKNAYILYKSYPDIPDYKTNLLNQEKLLSSVNKDLFVLSNDIESATNIVNSSIINLNSNIEKERNQNKELLFQYQQTKGVGNAAEIMIENEIEIYKSEYIYNINIFLGIVLLVFTIYNVFFKKIQVITKNVINDQNKH